VVDRLAARFLLILMALGSLALWTLVPAGVLWLISKLTESSATHFVAAIVGVPAGMGLFGLALAWVNGLYLRITRPWSNTEAGGYRSRLARGPLELLLRWSLFFAFAAFLVWFFVFAENPPSCAGR
jgi:hypothetical protein